MGDNYNKPKTDKVNINQNYGTAKTVEPKKPATTVIKPSAPSPKSK